MHIFQTRLRGNNLRLKNDLNQLSQTLILHSFEASNVEERLQGQFELN